MRPGGLGVGQAIVVGTELPKTACCFFWIGMTVEIVTQRTGRLVSRGFSPDSRGNVVATKAKFLETGCCHHLLS
jgi:hypothetical protein